MDDGSEVALSETPLHSVQGRLLEVSDKAVARPFLKWAGGKARLLTALRRFVPASFGKYIEPFLGGGALFFDTAPNAAALADSNDELIGCYQAVRDCPELLLQKLAEFQVAELDPSTAARVR